MSAAPLVTSPVTIFLVVMVIILLAPVVLGRLRVPHIVGMIVAGVIVGPYGLNILARDSSFDIFGQVGLLYLMYLAGLEIDMYHLRLNLRRGLLFGALTFVIPMVLGVVVSVWVLGLGWLTSLLLASMYASHTLIGYPVASRYGVTKNPVVLIAVVGTIVAVVGALLVLAGVVNTDTATGLLEPWVLLLLLVKLGAFCTVVIYLYPRAIRWFFKRWSDRVVQWVFSLALMALAAWGAGKAGLEPVLGAFLAGLVANRYVPQGSPLMSSIEFVGNALFIPYFLIGVGMMINVGVIARGDTLAVAAVMLGVALAGKWLPAWAMQRLCGMSGADRQMFFGLTTAHTAVALAVVTIGYNIFLPDGSRMMDEKILNGTVLVILVTCALAPIVTAQAARRLRLQFLETLRGEWQQEEKEEGASPVGSGELPGRMLVGVSNPITAASLVELALLMRRAPAKGQRLLALHVRHSNSRSAKAVSANSLALAGEAAAAAGSALEPIERYDLNPVTGIANAMAERDVSLTVLGMHRRSGVVDSVLGAKIEELLRVTDSMLVVARCYIPPGTVTRIVVCAPTRAEYEEGFAQWVLAVASLGRQIGCRVIFSATARTAQGIQALLRQAALGIRHEYRDMATEQDSLAVALGEVLDDDLVVVVGARPDTVSHSALTAEAPSMLQKYYSRNNLLLIYPRQRPSRPSASFSDPLRGS